MPVEKSAGAVVFRKAKKEILYLILHYEWGHWDFPKGNIERGEEPGDAAKREISEETGLKKIKFIPGFQKIMKYFYKRDGKNIFKIVVFFLAETKEKNVKISSEHKDFKWLPASAAIEQLTFKNAKKILKEADGFILHSVPKKDL